MWGDKYWPIFLTVVSALFFIPEIYSLLTNHVNDLSQYAWRQLNVTRPLSITMHTFAWYSSLAAFILIVVILIFHIWFRVT